MQEDARIGTEIGGCRIAGRVGRRGIGVVYRAVFLLSMELTKPLTDTADHLLECRGAPPGPPD